MDHTTATPPRRGSTGHGIAFAVLIAGGHTLGSSESCSLSNGDDLLHGQAFVIIGGIRLASFCGNTIT